MYENRVVRIETLLETSLAAEIDGKFWASHSL